ncbi:MAG: hypothetical protein JWQ04_2545 [Pedosphaera sp.]|nr:hypothetical protein [Pedosphaera sp.]
MFTGTPCFQKNLIFLGCEKNFFPYTEKGSFFCMRFSDLEEGWELWEWECLMAYRGGESENQFG